MLRSARVIAGEEGSMSAVLIVVPVFALIAAGYAAVALRFTPVSTVDPVGPTDIVVTSTTEGTTCSVTVRITPEGGTQMPATTC